MRIAESVRSVSVADLAADLALRPKTIEPLIAATTRGIPERLAIRG
jgi:hypothetical protein